jgi:drug/metabolite transporter (DMT)-like permease
MANALNSSKPSTAAVVAAFGAIYIFWGSTYLGIVYALQSFPPFLLAAVRFLIAGTLLLGWCLFKGEKLPPLDSVLKIAFSGLLMLFIGNGAVTWVEQYLPSGLAAIVVATVPLWFVLLDKRQWSFNFSNKGIIAGLLVGFVGVVLLFAGKGTATLFDSPVKMLSLLILVCGTIGWTAGSLYAKYKQMAGSATMKAAIQTLAASFAFTITSLSAGEHNEFVLADVSGKSILAMLYLITFGSLIGYLAYVWLLSIRSASLVGTYAYVNPVVAVVLGWAFIGETISTQQMIGLGIIIVGLLLVNLYKDKKKPLDSEPHAGEQELRSIAKDDYATARQSN